MLGRDIAAVRVAAGVFSGASAQDVKLPEIDFGRYHALVIGKNDYEHLPKLKAAVGRPWRCPGRASRRRC